MSAIIPQGIPRPHHAEPSQIPGTDTGIASDACVATHARSTDVGRLAGRPGPHGRQGLRTADAAYGMNRSGSRGEVFPYGLARQSQAQHMQENHVHAGGMGTGEEDPRALGKEHSGV